jgi:hypothetical protein
MSEVLTATPEDDVVSWRLHVLLRACCPVRVAEQLAESDVDLHEAVGLIERGCPPETAARILI